MRQIFFLYIPPGNFEALVHYQDTIVNRVAPERIYKYLDAKLRTHLQGIFGTKPITVWGSRDSSANRQKFNRMQPGDDILIVEGNKIKLLGKIAAKTVNPNLSRELWKNIANEQTSEGWDLIYFIANPIQIDLPFSAMRELFNYSDDFKLRGFSHISDSKLKQFYDQYDDLYSILQRLKKGESVLKKEEVYSPALEEQNDILKIAEELKCPDEIPEHLNMQWKLIQLGIKSGSKVWIPKNDQQKIVSQYAFDSFEKEFTAGIDTPAKYVENIDVVWKEEFRIDAAFEIENTTAIYSGLLRFSDLKIVAPNSNYPLFIVAPQSRRNRVIEQIKRPTFKKLDFANKVRFISYEVLDEVDNFFKNSTAGLNVELLSGKSEAVN